MRFVGRKQTFFILSETIWLCIYISDKTYESKTWRKNLPYILGPGQSRDSSGQTYVSWHVRASLAGQTDRRTARACSSGATQTDQPVRCDPFAPQIWETDMSGRTLHGQCPAVRAASPPESGPLAEGLPVAVFSIKGRRLCQGQPSA
jgi:hypothetical protein